MARNNGSQNRLKVRKAPRQTRSRSTVEAIKQAAFELIASEGFSASSTSTTLIAERAGVSVGSLYEYFPTREAILLALFEDRSVNMTLTLKRLMMRVMTRPMALGIPSVVRELLKLHREHELVLIKMVSQLPELKLSMQPLSLENMVFDTTRMALYQWNPDLSQRDLDRRAFFLREIMLSCIHGYLNKSPENVADAAFISDLAEIAMHYIALPPKSARRH